MAIGPDGGTQTVRITSIGRLMDTVPAGAGMMLCEGNDTTGRNQCHAVAGLVGRCMGIGFVDARELAVPHAG